MCFELLSRIGYINNPKPYSVQASIFALDNVAETLFAEKHINEYWTYCHFEITGLKPINVSNYRGDDW